MLTKMTIALREIATNTPAKIARCSLSEFLDIHNRTAMPSNNEPKRLDIMIPVSSGIKPKFDNAYQTKI
jgi:hypothetical protein